MYKQTHITQIHKYKKKIFVQIFNFRTVQDMLVFLAAIDIRYLNGRRQCTETRNEKLHSGCQFRVTRNKLNLICAVTNGMIEYFSFVGNSVSLQFP